MEHEALVKAAQYSAMGTVLAFASSVALAVSSTPGYRLFFQYLSDLGVGGGAAYFNYGCILTAAFIFAFFASVGSLERASWQAKPGKFAAWHWLATIAILTGIVAALSLLGVGLFPEQVKPLHLLASTGFFVGAAVSVLLLSVSFKLQEKATPGTLASGSLFIALGILYAITDSPLIENLAVVAFGAWLLVMAHSASKIDADI